MKKAVRRILLTLSTILLLFTGFLLLQRLWIIRGLSKEYAITTEKGIESLEFVPIGGIDQAILIRGNDMDNPILLDLHGGPGYPHIPTNAYKPEWEEAYTIVYFDQRLAGKTYFANDVSTVMASDTIELRIQDVVDLAEYLRERFHQEKIVLHGSSWGTVLGINAILERPDLFSAYIGNSQVVNQFQADTLVYNEILRLAREVGNQGHTDKLLAMAESFPTAVYDEHYYDNLSAMRTIARDYAGEMSLTNNGGLLDGLWPQFYSPYYSLKEATYFLKYTNLISEAAPKYMIEDYDMRAMGLDYQVPVFFISGEMDYSTPAALLEDVFTDITAPQKELHILDGFAHGIGYRHYTDLMLETVYPIALANQYHEET